jgi:DNA-binding MarR family transcriptional regulator
LFRQACEKGGFMLANGTSVRHEELAHRLFAVVTQFCLGTPRGRRRGGDLKKIEFLTLKILDLHGTMIVGDIQRLLGILPAQMSRVIRSLESRERALVACCINPHDKRKVDVLMTPAGEKTLRAYEDLRIQGISDLLHRLADDDLENIQLLLDKLQYLP